MPKKEEKVTMNIQEAFYHLYQTDKFEDESDEDYAARQIARDEFDRQLKEKGMSIQQLIAGGQLQPIKKVL